LSSKNNKLIISIISAQTIPNIEFIRLFNNNTSQKNIYLFITTEEMKEKNKTDIIIQICELEGEKVDCITLGKAINISIDEIYSKLDQKLKKLDFSEIYLNATGGNKLISYALISYCKMKKENISKVYYTDIANKNSFVNMFNPKDSLEKKHNLSVKDFLQAYGIQKDYINCETIENNYHDLCLSLFNLHNNQSVPYELKLIDEFLRLIYENYDEISDGISNKKRKNTELPFEKNKKALALYNAKDKTNITFDDILNAFNKIGYNLTKKNCISKRDLRFFNGSWFEYYTFFMLKKHFNNITDIQIGVTLNHKNQGDVPNNELDVVFTYKNSLFILENKVSALDDDKLNDYIYKLHSISKNFGLRPKSILLSLDKQNQINKKQDSLKRLKTYGIEFFSQEKLSPEQFKETFANIIK
jgi:uncharacterized protein YsxB (DUF464 family)